MGPSGAYFCGQLEQGVEVGSVLLVFAHLAITILSNYLPEGSTSHLVASIIVAVAVVLGHVLVLVLAARGGLAAPWRHPGRRHRRLGAPRRRQGAAGRPHRRHRALRTVRHGRGGGCDLSRLRAEQVHGEYGGAGRDGEGGEGQGGGEGRRARPLDAA